MVEREFVAMSIAGGQWLATESQTAADLAVAYRIVEHLSDAVLAALEDAGAEVIFPSRLAAADASVARPHPRVAALAPKGTGMRLAKAAVEAASAQWKGLIREVVGADEPTPGFPDVRWVVVPADAGYARQWRDAWTTLDGLDRAGAFRQLGEDGEGLRDVFLCDLGPRWPALPSRPARAGRWDRGHLCAADWVRRIRPTVLRGGAEGVFPSAQTVAGAFARRELVSLAGKDIAVLATAVQLRSLAVRLDSSLEYPIGGIRWPDASRVAATTWLARAAPRWLDPDGWDASALARDFPGQAVLSRAEVQEGRSLARRLNALAGEVPDLLAFVVHEIDDLDAALVGHAGGGPNWHKAVSEALERLAEEHRTLLAGPEFLTVPVAASGDRLVFLAPARTALAAAGAVRAIAGAVTWPEGFSPTFSAAVLFFRAHEPIASVLGDATVLLGRARESLGGRDGLGVAFQERARASAPEAIIMPAVRVDGHTATDVLLGVARAGRFLLSTRLLVQLGKDAAELDSLRERHPAAFRAELTRLLGRRNSDDGDLTPQDIDVHRLVQWITEDVSGMDVAEALGLAQALGQEAI